MKPKDRILDLFGSFVRNHDGWIPVSRVIELLAELDVDAQAVRSATSRMKRSGLLHSEKVAGRAGYSLTQAGIELLDDGDLRIFPNPGASLESGWVLALFSVPETERDKRYLIRSRLAGLGFSSGPASSLVAPASLHDEAKRMLTRLGLLSYVNFFRGDFEDDGYRPIEAWDLEAIRAMYDQYLDGFSPIAQAWSRSPGSDREAFINYMNNVGSWRPLPYADPGLGQFVPDWPHSEAHQLFDQLSELLQPAANEFFNDGLRCK